MPTTEDTAAEAMDQLAERIKDPAISASQLASLSSELRHWLDRIVPAPPATDSLLRAATALLEHSRSGGRRQAVETLTKVLFDAGQ